MMMKQNKINSLLAGLCLTLALTGCSSSKHATKTNVAEGVTRTVSATETQANALRSALLTDNVERTTALDAVTSKVNLTLKLGDKSPVKLNGTLRVRRDQAIQLSVTYLLGIEVGRVEITPNGVVIIDRVNRRYVDIPFAELTQLTHANLDYYTLQALFLNELFLPGQQRVTVDDASSFSLTMDGDDATLAVKNSGRFDYQFLTSVTDNALKRSRISYVGSNYVLNWDYDNFRTFSARTFPGLMQVDFEGSSKPASLTLELNKLSSDADWDVTTQVSSKYQRVEWKELLNQLMKL
jgi:hypothetical protein